MPQPTNDNRKASRSTSQAGMLLTPAQHLARLTWDGAQVRYPAGVPAKVTGLLQHELALIAPHVGAAPEAVRGP